ncbi:MAG: anti-sigma factor, partial [Acidimicrobiia bacterium]
TWMRISEAIGAGTVTAMPATPSSDPRLWQWVASIAAAAALVLGGLLVAQLTSDDVGGADGVLASAEVAASEKGAIVGDFMVEDVAVARVVLAPDGRGFVLPTESLDELDVTRAYQLWVISENEDVISAGVLGAHPAPSTFTWTGDVAGFALTREVAEGVVSSEGDVVSIITDL